MRVRDEIQIECVWPARRSAAGRSGGPERSLLDDCGPRRVDMLAVNGVCCALELRAMCFIQVRLTAEEYRSSKTREIRKSETPLPGPRLPARRRERIKIDKLT